MRLIHFVINISQKYVSSADVWKCRDSVLGHEDCLAANSKSTGPPHKSADDRNCSIDSAVRPTFSEWQNADVDGQWLLLWVYNCLACLLGVVRRSRRWRCARGQSGVASEVATKPEIWCTDSATDVGLTSGTGRSRRCVSASTSAFSINSIIGATDGQTLIARIAVRGKNF